MPIKVPNLRAGHPSGWLVFYDIFQREAGILSLKIQYNTPFNIIDRAVLMSEDLNVYDKAVYSILCSYANSTDRSSFPSYQTIANKAVCSRRKVIAVIAKLERMGLVEKQEQFNSIGDNTSNLYIVKPMSGAGNTLPSDAQQSPPGACHSPPDAYGTPKLYPYNDIQINENQSSITEEDGLKNLKAKINYSWFEEEMPDKLAFIDSLLDYIFELERDAKPEIIRLLASVDELVIIEFLDDIKGKSFANVKNFGGYIKKMFIEFLRRREIELAAI